MIVKYHKLSISNTAVLCSHDILLPSFLATKRALPKAGASRRV